MQTTTAGAQPRGAGALTGALGALWALALVLWAASTAVSLWTAPTVGAPRAAATVAAALGASLIGIGVVLRSPSTSRAWLLVGGGQLSLFMGCWKWADPASSTEAIRVGLLATTVGFSAAGYGLVLLARQLTRVWDRTRWIDATVVSLAWGVASVGAVATIPGLDAPSWSFRWVLPALPAAHLLLVLLATRSLLAVSERSTALRLLTLGLVVQFVGSAVARWFAPAVLQTAPAEATAAAGLATAVATVLVGLGALHRSVTADAVSVIPWRRLGAVRFAVLVSSMALPLVALVWLAASDRSTTAVVIFLTAGATALSVLVLIRVSGLVRYADALADERHRSRFESLVENSHDAVVILDADLRVTWASPALRTVVGPAPEQVIARSLDVVLGRSTTADLAPSLDRLALRPLGATMELQAAIVDADDRERAIEGTATNLLAEPAVEGIVVVVRDVTERVAMQRQLVEQAFVDPLTGLANRALFIDRVGHALARIRNGGDHRVAVIFIDLDDFKEVNDSLGHGRGDDLLVEVGRRIVEALGPADTAARLGGDEFAVLVEDVDDDGAEEVAQKILELLGVPLTIGEFPIGVTASIGIAYADDPGQTAAIVLRNADLAMYEAKRDGKGHARTFRSEMHERELRQFTYRAELQAAIEREQLHVLYQPIVDMDTEAVTGAEALIRWIHPEFGTVSPLDFIPLAESTRAIVPIGRWVLRTACEQLAIWTRQLGPLTMDVNVSAVQLMDPGFVADVATILGETGVDPGHVVLELTESILVHDAERALQVLEDLRSLGVRLAIDDFGTGYSSLAYLQNFPIDIVKIDRAFVNQLGQAGKGRSLARSIIAIAGSLGIDTIAEGIETPAQAADLSELECVHGQGFHYSRPIDPEAFAFLVVDRQGHPVPVEPPLTPPAEVLPAR